MSPERIEELLNIGVLRVDGKENGLAFPKGSHR